MPVRPSSSASRNASVRSPKRRHDADAGDADRDRSRGRTLPFAIMRLQSDRDAVRCRGVTAAAASRRSRSACPAPLTARWQRPRSRPICSTSSTRADRRQNAELQDADRGVHRDHDVGAAREAARRRKARVSVERPSRVVLRYTEPDDARVLIDGDTHDRRRGRRRRSGSTTDIGAAQGRVQKYFVDSSPKELRRHFDDHGARSGGPARHLCITMTPKRKQIQEGADAPRAVARQNDAAAGGDADDVPERRHQADDVHRRHAERADRSIDVLDRRRRHTRRRGAVAVSDERRPRRRSGTRRGSAPAPSCAACGAAPAAGTAALRRSTSRSHCQTLLRPRRFSTDRRQVSQYSSKKRSAPSAGSHSRWCMSNCAHRRAAAAAASPRSRRCPGSGVRIVKPAWNS